MRLSYPIAHGLQPRWQESGPSTVVRPRGSPNHNGGPRSVRSQGAPHRPPCPVPTAADGVIVRAKASSIARFGLIARGLVGPQRARWDLQ